MPVGFNRIGDGWIGHGLPRDAAHAPPAGARIPLLNGAVAIRAAIASGGQHLAIGQRDAGVVPAAIRHRLRGHPLIRTPVKETRQRRGAVDAVAAIHQQPPVLQQREAAAEHVVPAVVDFRKEARGRIPHRCIGELRPVWKGGALIRGKRQQPAIRQQSSRGGNMRRPGDDGAPGAHGGVLRRRNGAHAHHHRLGCGGQSRGLRHQGVHLGMAGDVCPQLRGAEQEQRA